MGRDGSSPRRNGLTQDIIVSVTYVRQYKSPSLEVAFHDSKSLLMACLAGRFCHNDEIERRTLSLVFVVQLVKRSVNSWRYFSL